MNIQEAIHFITDESAPGSKPGLERIIRLLELCQEPQEHLKVIHVAGTNGKGSVCAMLASILKKAGYRIGVFTSPYIEKINECICCGGQEISDGDLTALTRQLVPLVEQMEDRPSEFELLTAVALLYFAHENCDAVILEAGMGGRQDATNITDPDFCSGTVLLSIITNVELDHMAFLGATLQEIAFQKAGIIKKDCPVIFGGTNPNAQAVVRAQAVDLEAPMLLPDYGKLNVTESTLDGCAFDFEPYAGLRLSLAGLYQPYNAAIVLTALPVLTQYGFVIPEEAVRAGLRDAAWPARFEVLSRDPLILYDGAHNEAGMITASESIRHYFGGQKVHILTGVMRDKDYETMAELLKDLTLSVSAVTPANPRALDAEKLAACFRRHGVADSTAYSSIPEAAARAVEKSRETAVPLVALGSLYMYKEVKSAVDALLFTPSPTPDS